MTELNADPMILFAALAQVMQGRELRFGASAKGVTMNETAPLTVSYDQRKDVLTVDGVHYTGHIFRALALCEPGTWLRFEDRRDGLVTVFTPGPELERAFDVMTGKGAICGA
jgi:hypothetical protein